VATPEPTPTENLRRLLAVVGPAREEGGEKVLFDTTEHEAKKTLLEDDLVRALEQTCGGQYFRGSSIRRSGDAMYRGVECNNTTGVYITQDPNDPNTDQLVVPNQELADGLNAAGLEYGWVTEQIAKRTVETVHLRK
jgi:hypothetical protein